MVFPVGNSALRMKSVTISQHTIYNTNCQNIMWAPTGSVNDVSLTLWPLLCSQDTLIHHICTAGLSHLSALAPGTGSLPALTTLRAHLGPWLHGGENYSSAVRPMRRGAVGLGGGRRSPSVLIKMVFWLLMWKLLCVTVLLHFKE